MIQVDSESYLLNCSALPTIQTGETVRFAIRIHLPAGLKPGTQLQLHWEDFYGRAAYADITVNVQ